MGGIDTWCTLLPQTKPTMTKFNPENKTSLTYGECLDPAMKITDKDDARQYLAAYIKFQEGNMQEATGKYTAEEICKINLGYYAGYYSDETRQRVERLFNCSHPVFGRIKENGSPSGKEALECGKTGKTLQQIR